MKDPLFGFSECVEYFLHCFLDLMKTEICYKQPTADIFALVHDSEYASFAKAQNNAFLSVRRISAKTTFHT